MSLQQLLENLTPQVVGSLRRAIELGKWPNGAALSDDQRQLCAQAVTAWEVRNLPSEARTGYVPPKHTACADKTVAEDQPLNWR